MNAPTDQELGSMVAGLLSDCVPARSGNNGVSERNAGFRDGWNAARSFTVVQVRKAFVKLRAVGVDVQDDSWGEA